MIAEQSGRTARLGVAWSTLFVVGTDLFVVSPLLPLVAADFRIAPALAGLSVTVFGVIYMASAPLLGHVADRIGRRRMLTCCLVGFGAANLLTAAAGNFVWLLAARLFAGAMAAGVSPSVYALVGGTAPPERRATWLALAVSGLLVSLALGAPLGGIVGAYLGWHSVFIALAASSLVLVWANRCIWPADRDLANAAAQPHRLTISVLAPRLAPMVVWATALYGTYTYLGAGLSAAGFATAQIAMAIACYGGGAIGGVLIGGRLADRLGARLTGGIGFAGLCAAFLVLRLALQAGLLIDLALGLAAAVAQLFFPAQQAGLANDFPARRATVLAWNNSALFLGIALGSLVGGQAIALGGFAADLTLSAAIAIAGCLINQAVVPSPAGVRAEAVDRAA